MEPLPYEILDAMVQCFGLAFHFRGAMTAFLVSCGLPRSLSEMDESEPKFVRARRLLTQIGQTDEGRLQQRRILTELCKLRNLPDTKVPDPQAGLDALRKLKQMAIDQKIHAEEVRQSERSRQRENEELQRIIRERAAKLDELKKVFYEATVSPDRQRAGYTLEDLLKDLFAQFEIEYRKSYRVPTHQIDGSFHFDGFHYLVEARWRKDQPTQEEIGGLREKVRTKIKSTRGLFVSIQGYRPEVIACYDRMGTDIILIDGTHLIQVLEGRIDLRDLLKGIINKAAQEGLAYTPINQLL